MTKTILFLLISIIPITSISADPIERKYYTNCKEYYDFQGFYHNGCKEEEAKEAYKSLGSKSEFIKKTIDDLWTSEREPEEEKKPKKEEKK